MVHHELTKELVRDASLAAMSLILLLNEQGYQTITMSGYDRSDLYRELALPDYYEDIMLISVGKETQAGHATVRHSLQEIVFISQVS